MDGIAPIPLLCFTVADVKGRGQELGLQYKQGCPMTRQDLTHAPVLS